MNQREAVKCMEEGKTIYNEYDVTSLYRMEDLPYNYYVTERSLTGRMVEHMVGIDHLDEDGWRVYNEKTHPVLMQRLESGAIKYTPNKEYVKVKLEELRKLEDRWDGEDAPRPNEVAFETALRVLKWTEWSNIPVHEVKAHVLGGVVIFLGSSQPAATCSCMNSGACVLTPPTYRVG